MLLQSLKVAEEPHLRPPGILFPIQHPLLSNYTHPLRFDWQNLIERCSHAFCYLLIAKIAIWLLGHCQEKVAPNIDPCHGVVSKRLLLLTWPLQNAGCNPRERETLRLQCRRFLHPSRKGLCSALQTAPGLTAAERALVTHACCCSWRGLPPVAWHSMTQILGSRLGGSATAKAAVRLLTNAPPGEHSRSR